MLCVFKRLQDPCRPTASANRRYFTESTDKFATPVHQVAPRVVELAQSRDHGDDAADLDAALDANQPPTPSATATADDA
jgi:hypothetical protein